MKKTGSMRSSTFNSLSSLHCSYHAVVICDLAILIMYTVTLVCSTLYVNLDFHADVHLVEDSIILSYWMIDLCVHPFGIKAL